MKRKLPKHQTPPGQTSGSVSTSDNPDVRNNAILGRFREMVQNASNKQSNMDNAARIIAEGNEKKYDSLGYYSKGMTPKDIDAINAKAKELITNKAKTDKLNKIYPDNRKKIGGSVKTKRK